MIYYKQTDLNLNEDIFFGIISVQISFKYTKIKITLLTFMQSEFIDVFLTGKLICRVKHVCKRSNLSLTKI